MHPIAQVFTAALEKSDDFIRMYTKDFEGEDWYAQFGGVTNSPVWIICHLAYVRAKFVDMLTREDSYPEGWAALFHWGSMPLADPHGYPAPEEARRLLAEAKIKLLAWLETVPPEEFDTPPKDATPFFATKAKVLTQMTHHEAHHTGNFGLIRRMLGKDKIV
jgi:uncharacterized damage-inducible protein DinB